MPTSDSSGVVMSKRAQQALRESEEKFSKAFKNSPDSICINRHIDGVYLEINDGFTSVTGYTMQEVIGRSSFPGDLDIWVNKEDRDRMVAGLKAHGEIVGLEAAFRMKTGQTRVGLMSARALELGGEACILSTTRDITERKQTEAALKASEAKYRELSNSVPMGIFEMDDRGTLTFANTTLYDWFGYTEVEFEAGINILDLADLQDRQLLKENLGRISSLQSSAPREYSLHRKTGGKIQVLALTKPILTHGHVQGFRGILLDLTEKKKMETVINNAARLESLGVLAGGIAHDFNNLLTGIFGYIDLARSVSRDGQAKEYLEETLTSMNRAKALTLQLLTFAKGGSPVRKITPLIPFIQETVQFALSGSNIS
jgi:PAS domain S-box-containing protein